eukprot:6758279-Pyramimonas_sp.AAC.2
MGVPFAENTSNENQEPASTFIQKPGWIFRPLKPSSELGIRFLSCYGSLYAVIITNVCKFPLLSKERSLFGDE